MLKKLLHNTSLKANIAANFIGNGWSALIGIIFIPIYLKYIGAEGYGLIGIFSSLQVVLTLLDSGLSTTLNKEMSRLSVLLGKEQQMGNLVKTLGSIYWIMALIAGLIALCLSPLLAEYWVKPKDLSIQTITYSFVFLSLSLIFQFPIGFYSGGLLGLQRQVMLNIIRIVFATLKSVGALVVLILISNPILPFFAWTLFVSIIQAFVLKYFLWYYLPKRSSKAVFDKEELRNIWRFAVGMLGISLTAILLTQIDKIILSKVLSLAQFGYYTVGCTLGLIVYQITGPLSQSYFPKFSNLISLNKIEDIKRLYHQSCQLLGVLVLPATFILVFFSKEIIFIWTHNKTTVDNTWLVASVYALGTGMNTLLSLPYQLTLAYGWTKLGFYQNIFFLCLMIPLTIFFSLHYGALGGAASWATVNILSFFVTPSLIHNKLLKTEKAYWYWNDCIKFFLVCVVIIYITKYLIILKDLPYFIQFIILSCLGLIALIVNIFFAKNLKLEVILSFSRIKKRYFSKLIT